MKNPNIKTKVVHSESKTAWNVVGTSLGAKYKIVRVPYVYNDKLKDISEKYKQEAKEHAEFISWCFNHSGEIMLLYFVTP